VSLAAASSDTALVFVELGAVVVVLAVVARAAVALGVSPIPFYLIFGLTIGDGGFVQLDLSEEFIDLASQIGVVLLLLTLGLEYSAEELRYGLRRGWPAGIVDLVANFTPGVIAGLVFGWGFTAALLLGGITYISSSGVIAKLLSDLDRLGNRETPTVITVLVFEDLVMAAYLPLIGVLLTDEDARTALMTLVVAIGVVVVVLVAALRLGERLSRVLSSPSDEAVLLSVLGITLLVAGAAEHVQVSSAVGAFLVGIAVSGPLQHRAATLIGPLRDLFAALFFLFFALQIDPGDLVPALPAAAALAVLTALTKAGSAWWAARRAGIGVPGRVRAALTLIVRGEFSIVIAGLGVAAGVHGDLGAVAAAYVLILALAGPVLTRYADTIGRRVSPALDAPTI
jgi:CPA2 family monovalent cation:H+ antiporter-2